MFQRTLHVKRTLAVSSPQRSGLKSSPLTDEAMKGTVSHTRVSPRNGVVVDQPLAVTSWFISEKQKPASEVE